MRLAVVSPYRHSCFSFCRRLLLCTLLVVILTTPARAATEDTYQQLETFSNVLNILEKNYVEPIEVEKVIEGAIKGMLDTLDPHSSFMKPQDFQELQVETKGSFSGIGIEITVRDGILTVVSPIEGTPAQQKGIKAGDRIIKIENESTKDMTLMDAVKKLRGPKGSEVTISVHRDTWTEIKDFIITRDVIPLHSVNAKMLDTGYLYARVTNFQEKTGRDLAAAIKKIRDAYPVNGMVLDLRNNPGGLLDQAVKVCDLFLKEGVIVSTRGRLEDQNHSYRAHFSGDNIDLPMIVLVNEGSASASEIVAGALKDHKRALILGAQTFGKGSVQTIIPMQNNYGLRLTTARYYTPNGTSIQATGITPDIVVASNSTDPEEEVPAKENTPQFLREKDLKHHITNDNKETAKKDGAAPADKTEAIPPAGREDFMTPEEISRDQQLSTALIILKGLGVFEKL